MTLRQIFKDNVKYYRKQLRLSQEKLAELSGLSTNYIGEIERTDRKVTIDTIEKVANGFNIDPSLLLTNRKKWFIYIISQINMWVNNSHIYLP